MSPGHLAKGKFPTFNRGLIGPEAASRAGTALSRDRNFVGNAKIPLSLHPTVLARDPTLGGGGE